jgi:hypothetical protein
MDNNKKWLLIVVRFHWGDAGDLDLCPSLTPPVVNQIFFPIHNNGREYKIIPLHYSVLSVDILLV